LRGFEAGADDFLTKPVDDVALVKRVRNLARLKMLTDEMLMRASTEEQLGFAGDLHKPFDQVARGGRILLVEDNDSSYRRIQDALRGEFELAREADPASALLRLPDGDFDLIIVSLSLRDADGLRLCSQVRSLDRARHLPLLIIVEPGDDAPLLKGLDMGVNDYVVRPIDPERAAGEGAYPAQAQALSQPFAGTARGERRDGHSRPAHRAAQSPLYGEPSRHAVR